MHIPLPESDYPWRFVIELQSVKVETNVWHRTWPDCQRPFHSLRSERSFQNCSFRIPKLCQKIKNLPNSSNSSNRLLFLNLYLTLLSVLGKLFELCIIITNVRIFIELKRCFSTFHWKIFGENFSRPEMSK